MKRRRPNTEDYTVGWICALPIERAAAEQVLDEEYDDRDEGIPYTLGRIAEHNVVIACLPEGQIGISSAAVVATTMRTLFPHLRFGLMVGIGGGVPSKETDIRLGDVVISQPHGQHGGVVQYDFGKTGTDGQLSRAGFLNAPPLVLLEALGKLRTNDIRGKCKLASHLSAFKDIPELVCQPGPDLLFEARYNHEGGETCDGCCKKQLVERKQRAQGGPRLFYGTIASGNQVIKDAITRDRLSAELGSVLCFEMEAAGLMNNFPCLVIRGISDYSDSHKNKSWQPYAAATAAACAKELLSLVTPTTAAATNDHSRAAAYDIFDSAINGLSLDRFLPLLSKASSQPHGSWDTCIDKEPPRIHWVSKNIDYLRWRASVGSPVLWVSAQPHSNLKHVSPFVIKDLSTECAKTSRERLLVLYAFCSPEMASKRALAATLLHQVIDGCREEERLPVIQKFLKLVLDNVFRSDSFDEWIKWGPAQESLANTSLSSANIQELLRAPECDLLSALARIIIELRKRNFLLVLDESGEVSIERGRLLLLIRTFLEHFLPGSPKVKVLLTSQPLADAKSVFDGLQNIDHDKERKDCLTSLRFDNSRYRKIASEHEGSCQWILNHKEYKRWTMSPASRILFIEGKPGSGKSTLTKYFYNYIAQEEKTAQSAILAGFFYSYREGEPQRSHYNMFRSVLYDILDQDESFFYQGFQAEYRAQNRDGGVVDWEYASLKVLLKSLQEHSAERRIYLVLDAVDESADTDRREMLGLLFQICSHAKSTIKMLIASRPVGHLELRKNQLNNFIRLQDETRTDITKFTSSLLDGLNLSHVLAQAKQYILDHAQGVFLWVKLVGEELIVYEEEGYAEEEIFELLKQLPLELEDLYKCILDRIVQNSRNLTDAFRMFQFVLHSRQPLKVNQLLHALAISDNREPKEVLSEASFLKKVPSQRRILSSGGGFLEVKPSIGVQKISADTNSIPNQLMGEDIVQVMHQTAREFLMQRDHYAGVDELKLQKREADIYIAVTCLRYLIFCVPNSTLTVTLPHLRFWTSEYFTHYAEHLNKRPLTTYAVKHLEFHLDGCAGTEPAMVLTQKLMNTVTDIPTRCILCSAFSRMLVGPMPIDETDAIWFKDVVLRTAIQCNFFTTIEILLSVGARVNALDPLKRTPLWLAAAGGHERAVELLLAQPKLEPDRKDEHGRTPLSIAAAAGHVGIVKLLLARIDVVPDAPDEYGRTPLWWAASEGHKEVVRLLHQNGNRSTTSPLFDDQQYFLNPSEISFSRYFGL